MRIGVSLPQFGQQADEAGRIAWYVRRVEELGVDSLWVADRLLAPANPTVGYQGGDTIPRDFHRRLDPFALLSAAATHTERVSLGTNVLISPLYPPAFLARMLTTIDLLSAGRLLAGLGIGWSPEEYAAMDVPFEKRGKRLDEGIDALETMWTQERAEYQGELVTVPATLEELRPARRPHPPIYLSAFGDAALRRVGARAHGWLPAVRDTSEETMRKLTGMRSVIDASAREAGRDPGGIETVLRLNLPPNADTAAALRMLDAVSKASEIEHVLLEPRECLADAEEFVRFTEEVLTERR